MAVDPARTNRSRISLAIFGILSLAGCGDDLPDTGPRVAAASIVGDGVVTGRVYFDGPAPTPAVIRNTPCCPGAPATLADETVIVNPDGTLANVFVYLENGPAAEGSSLPAPVLDQKFCQYVPHVIGVVVGQPLTLKSSDPTYHNVKVKPAAEGDRNFSMKSAGETETTRFLRPGFATSHCDVHPWMNAVIGVFDNPFFAVTGADGTFRIAGIPDGTYTLVARHERYLALRQTVTIKAGQPAAVDFRYTPPKP